MRSCGEAIEGMIVEATRQPLHRGRVARQDLAVLTRLEPSGRANASTYRTIRCVKIQGRSGDSEKSHVPSRVASDGGADGRASKPLGAGQVPEPPRHVRCELAPLPRQ